MTDPLSREIEIEPAHAAILFVDVQKFNCTWDGGEYAQLGAAEKEQRYGYFFRTLKERALPNMALLQLACRRAGIEVTYTLIESLTADGRDRSLDYKITGFNVPKGSPDAQMVDELAPPMKSCFQRLHHRCSSRPISIMYCAISAPATSSSPDVSPINASTRRYAMPATSAIW